MQSIPRGWWNIIKSSVGHTEKIRYILHAHRDRYLLPEVVDFVASKNMTDSKSVGYRIWHIEDANTVGILVVWTEAVILVGSTGP